MKARAAAAAISLIAAAGLVLSGVAVWQWVGDRAALDTTDSPATLAAAAPRETPPASEARPGTAVPRSRAEPVVGAEKVTRPAEVRMRSLQVRMQVRAVGVSSDGQMQLPPDPAVLGWYRFGPAPGSASGGSVVLAGHLDSKKFGVGPLAGLRDVTLGQRVDVLTTDGRVRTYTVERVDRFDRRQLPAALFTRQGPERLRLITCGGDYDPVRGYEQNLVVTARPT
jgi:hypothetical protein